MKNQDPRKPIKIVYFGTSEFAVPALKSLLGFGYGVVAVITQPEKLAGRQRITMPSPVKRVALENNISVFEPHNLKDDEDFFKKFKNLSVDLCIVSSYGKIIPKRYLEIPKYGFINIHPSSLPKYRGPSPIQTAIMNGDEEMGVALMIVDKEMDHGGIVSGIKYKVLRDKNYLEIEKELAELGAELLIETLPKYVAGDIKPKEQDHSKATFTKLLTRHDGRINWDGSAQEIYNKIRALNPEPGTWTTWAGKTLNIRMAELDDTDCGISNPGTVVRIKNSIAVATKKCYLILKRIQLEGGREIDVADFVNGHRSFLGGKLE